MTPPLKVRDVPIPKRLRKRPIDERGFPIPFAVLIYEDGTPDFRVNDEAKRIQCATDNLCGLCGQKMRKEFAFIGGPGAAKERLYFDPPMHEECARYARQVCPYLAYHARGYDNRIIAPSGIKITEVHNVCKPDELVLYVTNRFRLVRVPDVETVLFHAGPPIKKLEVWKPK